MKLEQQCVSLDLAKKLKKLEVKQDSQFYWRLGYSTSESFDKGVSTGKQGHFRDYEIIHNPKPRYTTADVKWNESDLRKLYDTEFSAFTVAELGVYFEKLGDSEVLEKLPKEFTPDDMWNYFFKADFWAKILIHLLENNLINK